MESWDPTLLADLADTHRLIVFDNRGMGASTADATPFSIPLFAADAAGLLQALGLERVDVLGWSMGAMAALELALTPPGTGGQGGGLRRGRRSGAGGGGGGGFPPPAARRVPGPDFPAGLCRGPSRRHSSRLPKPAMSPDREIVRRQREALAAWPGFGDRLAGLDKDVLLVVGQEDEVTPPQESLKLAGSIRGSWLVRIRGGGALAHVPDAGRAGPAGGDVFGGRPGSPALRRA